MEKQKRKTKTSAQVKNRYNSKKYDRFSLMLPKGEKTQIQNHADNQGESINAFINRAIKETIARDNETVER